MAAVLHLMVLCLLMHGRLCSGGQTGIGCKLWYMSNDGNNVCCEKCHPGNILVDKCGPNVSSLCKPCGPGRYIEQDGTCQRCRTCVAALVEVKACTSISNTVCGCREGLTCGDGPCSFCVKTCGKGEEPGSDRLCTACPEGTFNDQIHQSCKPWSTNCPKPDQHIVAKGDALTDIKCANASVTPLHSQPDTTGQEWLLVLLMVISMSLIGLIIIVAVKILQKKKKRPKKTTRKTPIIRMPTDDPRTLIAIECSFHEAQQEQGSSTESLDSKDSSGQLIA